jgi:hypothetical protein
MTVPPTWVGLALGLLALALAIVLALALALALGIKRPARRRAQISPDAMNHAAAAAAAAHDDSTAAVRSAIPELIVISDAGEDLDDEMAFIMARYLSDEGHLRLKAVIANLRPGIARARLVRGTLDLLGLQDVPVGIGTDGGSRTHKAMFAATTPYMTPLESQRMRSLEPGRALLHRTLTNAAPGSLTLLLISSMKDAALFLRDNGALCKDRLSHVVLMGGVEIKAVEPERNGARAGGGGRGASAASPSSRGHDVGSSDGSASPTLRLVADSAHNNMFDLASARYLYARLQELGIPMTVVSRHAAYAVPVPRAIYDHLAQSGSTIGWRLRKVQRDSIEALWRRACAPDCSAERNGLPARCDKTWFSKTFCEGRAGERGGDDPVRACPPPCGAFAALAHAEGTTECDRGARPPCVLPAPVWLLPVRRPSNRASVRFALRPGVGPGRLVQPLRRHRAARVLPGARGPPLSATRAHRRRNHPPRDRPRRGDPGHRVASRAAAAAAARHLTRDRRADRAAGRVDPGAALERGRPVHPSGDPAPPRACRVLGGRDLVSARV